MFWRNTYGVYTAHTADGKDVSNGSRMLPAVFAGRTNGEQKNLPAAYRRYVQAGLARNDQDLEEALKRSRKAGKRSVLLR